MSVPRLILVGVVLVLVLYAVGAALTRRNAGAPATPGKGFSAWLGEVAMGRSAVSPEELNLVRCEFATAGRDSIRTPGGEVSTIVILANNKKKVRTLKLILKPGSPRPERVVYRPASSSQGTDEGDVRLSHDEQELFVRNSPHLERSVPVGPAGGAVIITPAPGSGPLVISLK